MRNAGIFSKKRLRHHPCGAAWKKRLQGGDVLGHGNARGTGLHQAAGDARAVADGVQALNRASSKLVVHR